MNRHYLATMILLAVAAAPAAAQAPLDIIPQDAAASIAIRDLDELIKRGDKFIADTGIDNNLRPSDLFREVNQFLGINQGLNVKRPAAIFLMRPAKEKDQIGFREIEQLIVPAIPFSDADLMAENFGIGKGKLKLKGIEPTKEMLMFGKFATRTNEHLYLSDSKSTLERLLKSKMVADTLTAEQRKQFDDTDILIHLGRYLWDVEGENLARADFLQRHGSDDPKEKEFVEEFAAGFLELQNTLFGFRLDDGVNMQLLATVPKTGKAAKLLAKLRDQQKPSTLQGLPEGNVLFAQASSGDTGKQALFAKAMFNFMLEDLLINQKVVHHVDRLHYLGVLHEVWRFIQGNRLAVYQNSEEKKHGLFTGVAILDVENAQQFVLGMRLLAKMATAEKLDMTKKEVKEELDIPGLVKGMGSSVYAIRQSATTKLALIGEPALPYLEKAMVEKQNDLEMKRRARDLRDRISAVAAERRKELLAEKPHFIRPQLTFISNVEKREGVNIDVINLKIDKLDKAMAKQFTELIGPDWDKIRLAIVGNQIVVLVGSDTALFDATLRNLKKGEPGLAATKQLAPYHARTAKDRQFEFHISVEGVLRLVTPKLPRDTPARLTSVALTLGAQSVQVDLRVPTSEVRAINRKAREQFGPLN